MDYGASDTSTTVLGTNQFPISETYVPNVGLTAVEGIAVNTDSSGKKSTAMRVGLKDGDDVAQGLTTDIAVTGDTSGTISGKLRGLTKIFTDVWDNVNHRLHVNVDAGSLTANAGTNLNTSALALEAGGNLATLVTQTATPNVSDRWARQLGQVDIARVLGAAISLSNPVPVQAMRKEITGLSAGPGSGGNLVLLSATDVSDYKWFTCHLTGTWGGNVVFWTGNTSTVSDMHHTIMELSGGISGGVNPGYSFSLNDVYTGRIVGRYIYIDCEPLNSGTVNAVVELWATPPPWLTANALLTPSNNFIGFLKNGVQQNARVAAGTSTDTLIKNGGGAPSIIGTVIINTSGTHQLDIYDSVPINPVNSGNPIMASVPANAAPGPYVFNSYCQFGIACQGNANNPGFSISFS